MAINDQVKYCIVFQRIWAACVWYFCMDHDWFARDKFNRYSYFLDFLELFDEIPSNHWHQGLLKLRNKTFATLQTHTAIWLPCRRMLTTFDQMASILLLAQRAFYDGVNLSPLQQTLSKHGNRGEAEFSSICQGISTRVEAISARRFQGVTINLRKSDQATSRELWGLWSAWRHLFTDEGLSQCSHVSPPRHLAETELCNGSLSSGAGPQRVGEPSWGCREL